MKNISAFLLVLIASASGTARTIITVDDNGPADFDNIQAAIDDANDGDTVEIQPGTYRGPGNRDIDFFGKRITVRSADPNDTSIVAETIIDCQATKEDEHRGFHFHSGEGHESVVSGLTITNGFALYGGAILCEGAGPLITRCIIRQNYGWSGGGIHCIDAIAPEIVRCTVQENDSYYVGGIEWEDVTNGLISQCLINNNNGDFIAGGIRCIRSSGTIEHCMVTNNAIGGIQCLDRVLITHCTVAENSGRGISYSCSDSGRISHCLIWGNSSYSAPPNLDVYLASSDTTVDVEYCNIEGGLEAVGIRGKGELLWGNGNISMNPLFADTIAGDYRLSVLSPCINAGDPSYAAAPGECDFEGEPRIMGSGVDIGADEFAMPDGPFIRHEPATLKFHADQDMSDPCQQTISIGNIGTGPLGWQVASDSSWLEAMPSSGTATDDTDEVTVSVDIAGLVRGTYGGQLIIIAEGAANSPIIIPVQLRIFEPGVLHVPAEFATIQEAIDFAEPGRQVILAPGRYAGSGNRDIDYHGKAITVRSADPTNPVVVAATIIDCSGTEDDNHRGFAFHSGEGPDSVLSGVSIINGYALVGGGIYCSNYSNPRIINCVIADNAAEWDGGGICLRYYCASTIENCIIKGNSASMGGGILSGDFSLPRIISCTVIDNRSDHRAGGGGGIECFDSKSIVSNCIVRGNAPSQIYDDFPGQNSVTYSNVEGGYEGTGNIDVDPVFVDANAGDYHLSLHSLCINAGDPDYVVSPGQTDMDGEQRIINGRIDIGPDEVDYEGPLVGINPTKCRFDANEGGPNPQPQSFSVCNFGTSAVSWEIDYDCNWLDVDPIAGTSGGESNEVTLTVGIDGMKSGSYYTTLVVFYPDVGNSSQIFEVTLHIRGMTVHVPAEFPTIQAAIDDVLEGGTVLVADGVYAGEGNRDIDFKGKAITVRSENGPKSCIVDCSDDGYYYHRGFNFHSGEEGRSVLAGFTITRGVVSSSLTAPGGAGVACYLSSPTISDCIIAGNFALGGGRGVASAGGGVFLDQSNAIIANCLIVGNTSDQGWNGAGIFCRQSNPFIVNCTICDNVGDGITPFGLASPVVSNCIVWGNTEDQIRVESDGFNGYGSLVVAFSNVQNGCAGLGNIAEDPCFASHGYFELNGRPYSIYDNTWIDGDYHLLSQGWRWDVRREVWTWDDVTSRCIDAGNPASALREEPAVIAEDPNSNWGQNVRINMGAYGGTFQASIAPHEWSISKDYNNDGIVNLTDLACWSVYHAYTLIQTPMKSGPSVSLTASDLVTIADRWLDRTKWFTAAASDPNLSPVAATNPNPPDGSPSVSTNTLCSWQPRFDAVSHAVYFGTTNPPPYVKRQEMTTFDPGPLLYETRYYWRIDEINAHGVSPGIVWTFTTNRGGGR